MIQRIRNRDVDLSPGPVGTYSQSGYQRAMGAVPLAMAIKPVVPDVAKWLATQREAPKR